MAKKTMQSRATPRDEARRARLDVYRTHVLAAAEEVLADHGFEAAKLQDISRHAKLSMGTIYAVFPGKAELLQAIFAARGREMLALVRDVVAATDPPEVRLLRLSEAYVDYFLAHPAFLRLHLREGRAWVMAPGSGGDDRVEIWREIHALQASIFQEGIRSGVFVEEEAGFLAKVFSALDQVVLADWVAGGMRVPRAALLDRLQRLVRGTFTRH